jgi:hypothetical protein
MNLLSMFFKEVYRHPVFALGIAVVLTGWIVFSFSHFALAADVESVRSEVRSISGAVNRSALEARIHSLESEIFGLERVVSDGAARDMDYDRLARLRSQLGTATRELARLD